MKELTPAELRDLSITALAVIGLITQVIKKLKERKAQSAQKRKNKFTPKQWTPDGWYYDEKKQKWVGPDYPQKKR